MATQLTNELNQVSAAGQMSQRTASASSWMSEQVRSINASTMLSQGDLLTNKITLGRMYLFTYSAKTYKKGLPYYDKYPLIFPFSKVADGFYGINMHYLPHQMRARLMDALMDLADDKTLTPQTKLNISYQILSSASRTRFFRPCVKHYLNSQIQSRFLMIGAGDWKKALFLPLEQFVGATRQQVYKDSRRLISRGR